MITRVRGTEDILDLTLYSFILAETKKHLSRYNFHHIRTPILEHTALFMHSLGAETDVVSKEMYIIDPEKKEKSLCLRPEHTASIIRACVENGVNKFPWKVFTHGPAFRRERPQKGRYRQFNQLSMEVVGVSSLAHDAHFIKMLDTLFSDIFMLEDYVIKLNFLGCQYDRSKHRQELLTYLESIESKLCKTCLARKSTNVLRIFDCKNPECQEHYVNAPKLTDHLCQNCTGEWEQLRSFLDMLSVSYVIDTALVRGLDYYHKTVFEFSSKLLGSQSAFCGAGRYLLGSQVGAKKDLDCVGAAIGMERLFLLVQAMQDKLPIPHAPALHVIMPLANEQDALALLLASQLQAHKLTSDIILEKASMTNMMKKANKLGAKFVLIIGEEEQKTNIVSVKNMTTGDMTKVKQDDIVSFLNNK